MLTHDAGEIEFVPARRVTVSRIVAAAVAVLVAGGFLLLWSERLPRPRLPPPTASASIPPMPKAKPPPAVAVAPVVPSLPPAPAEPPQAHAEPAPPTAAPTPAPALAAPTALPSPPPAKPGTERAIAALPPPPAAPPRDRSSAQALLPAPDPALLETTPKGPLPIISGDGRQSWRVYARPFDRADQRPRVALLITGLGPSGAATETSINDLPGAVTLSFDPYTRRLGEWIELARAAGHEVVLSLPMEPAEYPRFDPGPHTLLTSLSAKENLDRLDWVLSRVTGYVGITNMMGSRFTASEANLLPVFDELKKRGLMFIDGRPSEQSVAGSLAQSMGLPRVVSDQNLDDEATREVIDRHLAALEAQAKRNGSALGVGFAYPVTLERIALWTKTLEQKGLVLAPASALAAAGGQKGAQK
ncbi:MAG TPA: divergent polysaccharide deacetylase family protein [Stellaceae bacterium]|nr:divergent polysaccharide deacetylase family protein [Stellaceae bacterium]